ncbi:PEP-CTERM sorting domain-containing protein [Thalassotalea sp. SU-HH00458]|uniref:PEP-CTERM sorting domain-containing protein n=1 Tax=Thalassotalea sp. SU-HH00458 TaxID=3127657 RepID=UPI003104B452
MLSLKNNVLVVLVCISSVFATTAKAGLIDLGVDLSTVDKYTFAVGGASSSLILGSEAEIFGSVASQYYLSTAPSVKIHGDACYQASGMGPNTTLDGFSGTCDEINQLESVIAQANAFATALTGESISDITGTFTLDASAQNVYSVNEIHLATGEFLTISGNADDQVIINVAGNIKVGSLAGILLTGGISSANVLFNFSNNFAQNEFNFGGANISGTFLGNNTSYIMGDGATLDDVRFYTNKHLQANVQVVRTKEPSVEVPEPSTILMLMAGLFVVLMRSKIKPN